MQAVIAAMNSRYKMPQQHQRPQQPHERTPRKPTYRGQGPRWKGKPLQGLFKDGSWLCDCDPRLPAEHFMVKKSTPNYGRWFYTCQKSEGERCEFFLWNDDAKIREEAAVLQNSRTEPGAVATESKRLPEEKLEDAPKPVHTVFSTMEDKGEFENGSLATGTDLQSLEAGAAVRTVTRLERARSNVPEARTPSKRAHSVMLTEGGLITPQTGSRTLQAHAMTPMRTSAEPSSKKRAIDNDFLNLVSPATTPTPMRFKDAIVEGGVDPLTAEIREAVASSGTHLKLQLVQSISRICTRHTLRMQGALKGRDISRLALKARDAKIVELQRRIETLEAELETEREIIRHLRWEKDLDADLLG